MKPVFTFLAFCFFIFICLVYLRVYGFEELMKFLMNNALGYGLALVSGGFLADIIKEARS
jgi:hypothetical protein